MAEGPDSSSPSLAMISSSRPVPVREDCWSEDATFTLIEAWGQRYIELNRGNLRQKQWQEVADTVNNRHGHVKKARRTDVQCKNRIDTLKKKYKIEKARVLDSNGEYKSSWPFFDPLDQLIGSTMPLKKVSSPSPPMAVPLIAHRTPVILPQKRPAPSPSPPVPTPAPMRGDEPSYFRKNYSAIAAAAAAAAAESEDEDEDEEEEEEEEEEVEMSGESSEADGIRKLARVIEKFGEVYAKVEAEKQRQMVELEKQRMQFAKEMECQRMQMLVEMQVQLEKVKRAKRSDSNGGTSLSFMLSSSLTDMYS
ncbi:trihelix transcription factor ASIL2-like isoform X2 [Chenopodium quinoa]|uniref:trihelix transcription factor ASIL2-like isoform X2 n=1 Tax=Chenopodium quinoa TaxID=63459 RepID=UPI000B790307|nr:trihelix transcription factor ASIL2-like isoform X2 [Chenopodium quinoa]